MAKIKVLAVDHEPAMRKLLERGLSRFGYDVTTISTGAQVLEAGTALRPDMILLDIAWEMPSDGLTVCRQIRAARTTPIIMLAERDEKQIRLAALNAGADDYLPKPFDMDELEARMRAVLRRTVMEESQTSSNIHVHDLVIDFINRRVMLQQEDLHLTPKEYDLLRLLATHPGKVLTFQYLLEAVWGETDSINPQHNVRVYINTMRKKLKDDPSSTNTPHYIYNEPGVGYRFTDL